VGSGVCKAKSEAAKDTDELKANLEEALNEISRLEGV